MAFIKNLPHQNRLGNEKVFPVVNVSNIYKGRISFINVAISCKMLLFAFYYEIFDEALKKCLQKQKSLK